MTIMEKGALVRALYTNHPEAKNELFFRKGDILTVIEYDFDGQPGWWLCALRGQRGICPSNYLEILEDKYSTLPRKSQTVVDGVLKHESDSKVEVVNPLDTYDFPRSEPFPVTRQVNGLSSSSALSLRSCSSSVHEDTEHIYINEPLYQNEGAEVRILPEKQEVFPEAEEEKDLPSPNPLDLYDVPRNELPFFGQSISRLRKYGSCTGADSLDNSSLHVRFPEFGNRSSVRGRSASSLGLSGGSSSRGSSGFVVSNNSKNNRSNGKSISQISGPPPQVELRRSARNIPSIQSNRSSIQSESAESGIVMVSSALQMQDLYDVPRSTANPSSVASLVQQFNKGGNEKTGSSPPGSGSRPQSALSVTSSGMGLSIATSDSKDSLDCLYDVPRTAIKAYVNHMETKYDELSRHRHDSSSSSSSFQSAMEAQGASQQLGHSRHNSTSSIFSAYGYTRQGSLRESVGATSNGDGNSTLKRNQSIDELYDVPRGTYHHPLAAARNPPPVLARKPMSKSRMSSNASLNSDSVDDPMQFYDVPAQFARKVSLQEGAFLEPALPAKRGVSASSLFFAASKPPVPAPQSSTNGRPNSSPSKGSFVMEPGRKVEVDVKLLPLAPKAAVSVCEKLRMEVVSSITSILNHVKPKWRSKENLTEIMPDLKFSCTRLSLAIKDIADFATRSLSNAKRLSDDTMSVRLHRLLTPVINGSQIIQRDVDELEAYFWSVDRLSVQPGSENDGRNASGDALDQLILCSRSLKHDVTELANFLALHSTALYKVIERSSTTPKGPQTTGSTASVQPETKVEDTQEDYDYVSLVPTAGDEVMSDSGSNSVDSQKLSESGSTSTVSWQLDSRDQQLLEFYSAQISVTAPQLSQSIGTFISAIQQNEPPSAFNIHLKYVILLGYKLLFAGDTVHRNIGNQMLKEEVEMKANDLHKSIMTLYEASKIATVEFPKIAPMQMIVDRVWATTQAATQLKKVIFNAVYSAV